MLDGVGLSYLGLLIAFAGYVIAMRSGPRK